MRRWLLPLLLMSALYVWFPASSNTNAQDECVPSRHEVGSYGRFGSSDTIYSEPSINSEPLGQNFFPNSVFEVVSEPICIDGQTWIEIAYEGNFIRAWIIEHTGYEYKTYLVDEADALIEPCESMFEAGDTGQLYYSANWLPIYAEASPAAERLGELSEGDVFTALGEYQCDMYILRNYFGDDSERQSIKSLWIKVEVNGVVGWIEEIGEPLCDCDAVPGYFVRPSLAKIPEVTGIYEFVPAATPSESVITTANADQLQAKFTLRDSQFIDAIWNPTKIEYGVIESVEITIYRPDESGADPAFRLSSTESRFVTASYNHDGTLLGVTSADGTAWLWETETYTLLHTLQTGDDPDFLAFSPDERWLAVNTSLGIDLFALIGEAPTLVNTFPQRADNYLGFSRGSSLAIVNGNHSTLIDPETGVVLFDYQFAGQPVSLIYHANSDSIVMTVNDENSPGQIETYRYVLSWQLDENISGNLILAEMPEGFYGRSVPYKLFLSPDGNQLITHIEDRFYLSDLSSSRSPEDQIFRLEGDYSDIVFSPDSQSFAMALSSGVVSLYNASGQVIMVFEGENLATRVRFSADGRYLLGFGLNDIVLWSTEDSAPISKIPRGNDDLSLVSFTPDSQQLLIKFTQYLSRGNLQESVTTFGAIDVNTGVISDVDNQPSLDLEVKLQVDAYDELYEIIDLNKEEVLLSDLPKASLDISWVMSPDGSLIVYPYIEQGGSGFVLLNLLEPAVYMKSERIYNIIQAITFSYDGRYMAVKGATESDSEETSGIVHIWDVITGALVYEQRFEWSYNWLFQFSPDKQWLVWVDETYEDNITMINRLNLETLETKLTPLNSVILGLFSTVSYDASLLISTTREGNLQVIDATTGELIVTLMGHNSYLLRPMFSPDGTKLASRSGDGTIIIWALEE